MKKYEISIGQSVGDIAFGMSRSDIRLLLGNYREFSNSPGKEDLSFDQFSFCNIGYDSNDRVEFVCFHTLDNIEIILHDRKISNMLPLELLSYINSLDNILDIEDGGSGFESNPLGIAAYFENIPVTMLSVDKEILCEKVESIAIAIPGYWDKYKR